MSFPVVAIPGLVAVPVLSDVVTVGLVVVPVKIVGLVVVPVLSDVVIIGLAVVPVKIVGLAVVPIVILNNSYGQSCTKSL